MAGSVTHTYFSKDLYKKLDKNTKLIIENSKDSFKTFNQGFDIIYFSSIRYSHLIDYIHENNTQDFFLNLVNYIRKHNLKGNPEVMSFLYGFICHYSLDVCVHPYVIYKAGYFNKKNKSSYKYKGMHNEMECYIDAYMINKNEKINPRELDIGKFCFDYIKMSETLINLIDEVMYETYNIKHLGKYFQKGLKRMKFLYSHLRYDKNGRKKKFYKFLDKYFPNKKMTYEPISLDYKLNKNHFYLNLDHRKWCHPMNKRETYTTSFDDIYNEAIKLSIKLINVTNEVIYYNKTSNYLKKFFTNISMHSGKDCNLNKEFKYFEF